MSRPLSVNQSSRVRGSQSNPTELRRPAREHFEPAAVGVHPHDHAVAIRVELADVARHADRNVELAVRPEGDELAPVMAFGREAIADDDRRRRIGEAPLDVVEAKDARHRGHVERAVAKRDAGRLAQSRRDHAGSTASPFVPGGGNLSACTAPAVLPTNSVPAAPHVICAAFGTRATTSIENPGGSLSDSSGSAVCARRAVQSRRAPRREPMRRRRRACAAARCAVRQRSNGTSLHSPDALGARNYARAAIRHRCGSSHRVPGAGLRAADAPFDSAGAAPYPAFSALALTPRRIMKAFPPDGTSPT